MGIYMKAAMIMNAENRRAMRINAGKKTGAFSFLRA
jgi:hypothetical protein